MGETKYDLCNVNRALMAALEPLRNDIIEAAETDTQWEEVARVVGWLEVEKGRGWYCQVPIWHWLEFGHAICGGFRIFGVKLIEKLYTGSGGLARVDCIIPVMGSPSNL